MLFEAFRHCWRVSPAGLRPHAISEAVRAAAGLGVVVEGVDRRRSWNGHELESRTKPLYAVQIRLYHKRGDSQIQQQRGYVGSAALCRSSRLSAIFLLANLQTLPPRRELLSTTRLGRAMGKIMSLKTSRYEPVVILYSIVQRIWLSVPVTQRDNL